MHNRTRPMLIVAALVGLVVATLLLVPGQSSASLANPARGTTIKATEGVNIRTGPSTAHAIITTAPAATTATVLSPTPSGGFYQVNYRGSVGWTHGDYWNAVAGLVVNGYQLTANEERSVRWIAGNTVARVQGTTSERLTVVSRVAWWSLKEGVLGLANPHSFSNCDDSNYDPLATCGPGCCWQVGISAIQVPNVALSTSESTALRLYPGSTLSSVLAHTATYSGFPSGTTGHDRIVNSTGSFRNSWLLRNHGVGFTLNEPFVTSECVNGTMYWCYGTGWSTSARYAPNKSAALRSISELRAILYALGT